MTQKANKKAAGFTLIDVLVGLVLIGMAMLVLGLVYPGLRLSQLSRAQIVATSIAEKKMAELKHTQFDSLTEVSEQSFSDPELANLVEASAEYSVAFFDVNNDLTPEDDVKHITVSITFKDVSGFKTKSLESTVSKYGVGQ